MRGLFSLATALAALGAVAAADAPSKTMPDHWSTIDLETVDLQMNGSALVPRTPIIACESTVHLSATIYESESNKKAFAQTMSSIIKTRSNHNNCGFTTGEIDGIRFKYHATGKNCDTTAQQTTIQGALRNALRQAGGNSMYPTMCFRLRHGGTWTGYLAAGPSSRFDDAAVCDKTLHFDDCIKGGNKDARSLPEEQKDMVVFPSEWYGYGLGGPEETSSLEKRKQETVCSATTVSSHITNTLVSLGQIKSFVEGIASLMKTKSNQHDCATSVGRFGDISYRYYASGGDCSTTSELGTIEGALYHQLRTVHPDRIPDSECISFDHGGKWHGWLLYGPAGKVQLSHYCGPALSFSNCHKGGKKFDF